MEPIDFLTYGDVVDAGACLDGVTTACKRAKVWAGTVEELLPKFKGNENYILKAAKRDGYGYGYGYGNGDGDGDGNGYGYGDGNGDGYGYGYGDGNGDGYGYGYGDGNGYGNGYGYGDGNGDGYGEIKAIGD